MVEIMAVEDIRAVVDIMAVEDIRAVVDMSLICLRVVFGGGRRTDLYN